MKSENIYSDLLDATKKLLVMAKDHSFNRISDNCLYIISEIKHEDKNLFERIKIRKIENSIKTPKSLYDSLSELESLYPNFYDVNLVVYRAGKKNTILEIQYYPRSSLDLNYQQNVYLNETMLHCKVALPPYCSKKEAKFDINWELGTLKHKWKMFWWRRKTEKDLKNLKSKV